MLDCHYHHPFTKLIILKNWNSGPLNSNSSFYLPCPQATTFLLSVCGFGYSILRISELTKYLSFCDWCWLSIMLSSPSMLQHVSGFLFKKLNNPLHEYATFFFHSSVDCWVAFAFWLLQITLLGAWKYTYLFKILLSNILLSNGYQGIELLYHIFNF